MHKVLNFFKWIVASKQVLTQGKTVLVFGQNNSDGSVTAQNVQINPQIGRVGINSGQ